MASLVYSGMGTMHTLSDEIMLELLSFLPAQALAAMSMTSKSLYAFSTYDDLWKALVLEVSVISQ